MKCVVADTIILPTANATINITTVLKCAVSNHYYNQAPRIYLSAIVTFGTEKVKQLLSQYRRVVRTK